jgi:hypothetical protein
VLPRDGKLLKKVTTKRDAKAAVQRATRDLLERNPAFSRLPASRRDQIARDTIKVAEYLAELPKGTDGFGNRVQEVNFPTFVADLLKGVFDAIVKASIDQMKAFAELIAAVAKSLDQFRDQNISDKQARDFLTEQFPHLKPDPPKLKSKPPAGRLATGRQQLLATMVLMGINRVVVTDGRIRARKPAK